MQRTDFLLKLDTQSLNLLFQGNDTATLLADYYIFPEGLNVTRGLFLQRTGMVGVNKQTFFSICFFTYYHNSVGCLASWLVCVEVC